MPIQRGPRYSERSRVDETSARARNAAVLGARAVRGGDCRTATNAGAPERDDENVEMDDMQQRPAAPPTPTSAYA